MRSSKSRPITVPRHTVHARGSHSFEFEINQGDHCRPWTPASPSLSQAPVIVTRPSRAIVIISGSARRSSSSIPSRACNSIWPLAAASIFTQGRRDWCGSSMRSTTHSTAGR